MLQCPGYKNLQSKRGPNPPTKILLLPNIYFLKIVYTPAVSSYGSPCVASSLTRQHGGTVEHGRDKFYLDGWTPCVHCSCSLFLPLTDNLVYTATTVVPGRQAGTIPYQYYSVKYKPSLIVWTPRPMPTRIPRISKCSQEAFPSPA